MITDSLGAVSFLLFLGLVLGSLALGGAFLLALLLKKVDWALRIAALEVAGIGLYAVLFLIAGLTSHTQVLGLGQEKHICEVDCHMAYAVTGVKRTAQWDDKTARGVFYVVTVRARFDSLTTEHRHRATPLMPNPRTVEVIDAQGRRYPADPGHLYHALYPGEEFTTDFVFDLPADATDPRLVLAAQDWPTRFMIAHENAYLHGKVLFELKT
ncbi:MAG TPA: hypothetical protein VMH88_06285 [Gemmatimonadales bacterium]|nr:hypothetical protein [Gemmatimonadales bacterium]